MPSGERNSGDTLAMHAAVIVFPGSNRDRDAAVAIEQASGRRPAMVWHKQTELPSGLDLIVLPGGFSYGDYLRCGAMAATAPVMAAVRTAVAKGVRVLGICNGFQILCEAGLLPGVLLRNANLRFISRWVHLRVERTDTPFTTAYASKDVVSVPVAHGDGNYFADDQTIAALEGEGRIAFRYCDAAGTVAPSTNLNGSLNSIAGIYSADRRVLGLMPHPEAAVDPLHGGVDGLGLFRSLVQ